MNEQHRKQLEAHAQQWEKIAFECEQMSKWGRAMGIHPEGAVTAQDRQAATYKRVAQAFRLEAANGVPHCSDSLRPRIECEHCRKHLTATTRDAADHRLN